METKSGSGRGGERNAVGTITASDAARETLAMLKVRYGDVILHVAGGWSKMPLCLPAGELRLGPRDIFLGTIDGVEVYEMQITPEVTGSGDDYLLDVVAGVPVGFSLVAENGMNFKIERKVSALPS